MKDVALKSREDAPFNPLIDEEPNVLLSSYVDQCRHRTSLFKTNKIFVVNPCLNFKICRYLFKVLSIQPEWSSRA